MAKKYFTDIVINKEKLSNKKDVFVAYSVTLESGVCPCEDQRQPCNIKRANRKRKVTIPVPLHKELAKGTLKKHHESG